jgi:flagella basal body P-ring formation protein FlgA
LQQASHRDGVNYPEMKSMNLPRALLLSLLLCAVTPCGAAMDPEQLTQIQKAVEDLLRRQTAGLPGRVSYTVGVIENRLSLAPCPAAEAFIPAGVRLWGNANIGVRCSGGSAWTIYVPVTVRISTGIVIAARALTQGRPIEAADLILQDGDLTQLPASVVTDPAFALGRSVTHNIAAGQPLRHDLLRSQPVVQQGQSVTVRSQGPGFKVSTEGKSLTTAAEGQVALVRIASGQTVSGIARAGAIVDIQQ